MKLSQLAQGRANNFNLIRILAAFAVLVTHSFVLTTGREDAEPLRAHLGTTLGLIAVDVFFITSGFLVTASLLTRRSMLEFIWARVLRIYPALLVMVFVTVCGLGSFFTSGPWIDYISHPATRVYAAKCSTLFNGVAYTLPGVFDSNPYRYAVNGSLWTMPYEVRMYAILAAVWVGLRRLPQFRFQTFGTAIVTMAAVAAINVVARHFLVPNDGNFARLFFMFFTGAAFHVLKDHIDLSGWVFWPLAIALALSTVQRGAFFVVYTASLAYITFYLAYIPAGRIRNYNRVGDYSYGFYIYAFPVQQSVAALVPGITAAGMIPLAGIITLLVAALSWHLLEHRALRMKSRCADRTRQLVARACRLHILGVP